MKSIALSTRLWKFQMKRDKSMIAINITILIIYHNRNSMFGITQNKEYRAIGRKFMLCSYFIAIDENCYTNAPSIWFVVALYNPRYSCRNNVISLKGCRVIKSVLHKKWAENATKQRCIFIWVKQRSLVVAKFSLKIP